MNENENLTGGTETLSVIGFEMPAECAEETKGE